MLIIPKIRLTALIFTIGPPVPRITLIPSSFYLSNSLSSLRRYEAGNKTLGLKGSSQALPPLDCLPTTPPPPHPPSPPTPAALLISLIFNLTRTVINVPPMKAEKTQRIFCSLPLPPSLRLSLIRWASFQLFHSPPFLMTSLSPD